MLHLIFCIAIWSTIGSYIIWKILNKTNQGVNYLKKLHQILCPNCIYFTGDYRLKCTVDPIKAMTEKAMTEKAIACNDFSSRSYSSINNEVKNIK